jgi:predicted alpha/beta hydrolase family esterase
MLARLQRIITLLWLAVILAWPIWAWQHGHPVAAVVGALLIIGAHAVVLGLEFVLMHRINRDDPAPSARPVQVLQAWWGEVISAPRVFCWRQPFRSGQWPDLLSDGSGRGVVLVHGFVCNRGLWNPWLRRLRAAGIRHVAVNLEPVLGSIDDYLPVIDAAVRALEEATGQAPVIVAHSMGGLAVRHWWSQPGHEDRVAHLLTLGTPHHGTWLARYAMSPNARQMRRDSRWLQSLRECEPAARASQATCFYSHCDNIVFPASSATWPGADNRHLAAVAHVHMADHPEPYAELLRRLQT